LLQKESKSINKSISKFSDLVDEQPEVLLQALKLLVRAKD